MPRHITGELQHQMQGKLERVRGPCPMGPHVSAGLQGCRWRTNIFKMLKDHNLIESHMPVETLS